MDGHLDCFHLLAFIHSATVNLALQIPLQDSAFSSFAYMPRSKILDHMIIPLLTFLRRIVHFSIAAVQIYIPTSSAQGFRCVHILADTCYFLFFLIVDILIGVRYSSII